MVSTYRRHGVVIALALVTGLATTSVRPTSRPAALPAIGGVLAATTWRIAAPLGAGSWPGWTWAQWRLRSGAGTDAVLYLAATSQAQKMVHWTAELAYQGAGYQVLSRKVGRVWLRDGRAAPYSSALVQRLTDRELLLSAVVDPRGIRAHATDDLLGVAWDTLRGGGGPYYLVRLSLAADTLRTNMTAARGLLSSVLSVLTTRT